VVFVEQFNVLQSHTLVKIEEIDVCHHLEKCN